ncbi:phospholipase D family protein [Dokdonella sp.]|uniref:phospholipase D family protein n=1 Tax=Dokdonella sp. TaxID=2291710 RepID=UPI003C56EFCB
MSRACLKSSESGVLGAVVLLCCLVLSSGCSVNRKLAREADQIVARTQASEITCTQADRCAIDSPYRALAAESQALAATDDPVHFVNLLEEGEDSLLVRIHLVRAARTSIDIQTFIWVNDDSGRLLLDELLKAAKRGVRVRVIADQLFSLEDPALLSRLAVIHRNFEFRIYNPTFNKAVTQPLEFAVSILCCFTRFNQRMHNKLFLVDGVFGIAGGRNYENRYFDWDPAFDYRDRDVLVTSSSAGREMQASFDQFWNYKRAVPLTRLNDVNRQIVADSGEDLPLPAPLQQVDPMRVGILSARAGNQAEIARRFTDIALRVSDVDYFSDQPQKQDSEVDSNSELGDRIESLIASADQRVLMQTPYLVLSKQARRLFGRLNDQDPKPEIIVSTNSLASTDAFYVYALSHKYKKRYLKLGFRIYEFKPFPEDADLLISDYAVWGTGGSFESGYQRYGAAPLTTSGIRVGMHAKSIVIDGQATLIGSHNFDPRSDNYNTESGFIIRDDEVARLVGEAILRDIEPQNAWTIAKRPRTNFIHRVNNAIADFSTALPLFDFWPFRYSTSYELNPGCKPLPQNDPGFYDCYTAVGDFPEVDLPMKTIYTRTATAIGAGAVGIL